MGASAPRRRHECLFGGCCEAARLRDIAGSSLGPRTAACPLRRLPTLRRTSLSADISSYRHARRTSFGGVECSTPGATVPSSRVASSAKRGVRRRQSFACRSWAIVRAISIQTVITRLFISPENSGRLFNLRSQTVKTRPAAMREHAGIPSRWSFDLVGFRLYCAY